MPGLMEDDIVEAIRRRSKMLNRLRSCKKDFKHTLKHGKDDLSLVQLGSHLCIEESLRVQDSKKGKGKEVGRPSVNMTEEGGKNKNNKQNKGKKCGFNENNGGSGSNKKPKLECWKCGKTGHFKRDCRSGNKKKANADGSGKGSKLMQLRGGLIPVPQLIFVKIVAGLKHMNRWKTDLYFTWGCRVVVRLPEPKRKTLSEKGIDCIFVGYIEHSKAYRFYVIEPNDSVSINLIIESRDAIFDENHFSSIPRLKEIIPNSNKYQRDDHSNDVPSETPEPRRAIQSQDAAFWKEAIDDEIGSIMENNTWVLFDLPPGCKPLGCKWIFKRKMKVDGTIDKFKARLWHQKFDEVVLSSGFLLNHMLIFGTDQNQVDKTKKFLSSRFSMKDMGEANVILSIKIKHENKGIVITQSHYIKKILKKFNREDCSLVSTPMDLVKKLKPNTCKHVDQLGYSRAIGCLMYAMTSTRLDIAYAAGRLSRFTSNPSRQHWHAITMASKKQTCITGSTMESEFVALVAVGKEAQWLRNLIHEILIWPKPIASIFIHYDSVFTLAKAYSKIYNGKSRHLGVRHSMIRELIMNGVISIEFVQLQHNLADQLTKGLARDLVTKSVLGMGLKSIKIYYL
nr:hypothetical protein [Tanacetum cinerariifolium]